MIPDPIEESDCKLLDAIDVVTRYSNMRLVLQSLAESFPAFLEREELKGVCDELQTLRQRITQNRYRIGFIGVSQAGKSSTAGRVLGATSDETNPCPPGGDGKAATAIATRIIPVSSKPAGCLPNEDHRVELVYMSTDQLRNRLSQFANILDLKFDWQATPKDWLEQCEDARRKNPLDKVEDFQAAIRILKAAATYPTLIRDKPVEKQGSFDLETRKHYVIHPDDENKATEYALLSEMRVWYNTNTAPDSLELIDLPGLGVSRGGDESLTLDFLPQLNGAFLFSQQDQLQGKSAAQLTTGMRSEFGKSLGGRIWYVVTKGDLLEDKAYSDPESTFKTISEELRKRGFAQKNLVVTSLPLYNCTSATADPLATRRAWETIRKPGQRFPCFSDTGDPITPPAIEKYPAFRDAYIDFVTRGGVPRIRELMEKQVVESVRQETQAHSREVLDRAAGTLRSVLSASQQMGGMTHEQIESSAIAGMELDKLVRRIKRSDDDISPIYVKVKESLIEILDRVHNEFDGPSRDDQLTHARLFVQRCDKDAEEHTRSYVSTIKAEVMRLVSSCSANEVPMIRNAIGKWDEACNRINGGLAEPGAISRKDVAKAFLMSDDLARRFWPDNHRRPKPDAYHKMMQEKIDCVTQSCAIAVATAVATAIARLAREYRSVGNDSAAANSDQMAVLASLESRLSAR